MLVAVALALLSGCTRSSKPVAPDAPVSPPNAPISHAVNQQEPSWSPQGILAYRDNGVVAVYRDGGWLEDTDLSGIWVRDFATGAKRRILAVGESPCWSPNGSLLALEINGEICVAAPDGTNLRQLTSSGANYFPTWNASGTRIIYNSNTPVPPIESRIYTVDLVGEQPCRSVRGL